MKISVRLSTALLTSVVLLGAVGGTASGQDASPATSDAGPKSLSVGFFPGPYADMFTQCAQPVLEAMNYEIRKDEFTNAIQPNTAVMNGDTNATIFQNIPFMESYNEANGGSVARLMDVPTLKSGFYSKKHDSFDELADGMKISIANDPTNLALGLRLLAEAGLLTLNEGVDPAVATEKDVATKAKDFELLLIDAPQAPRSLDDVDYALVLGSWIFAAGLPDDEQILMEGELGPGGWIIVSARESDLGQPWALDLQAAYESPEFKACIDADPKWASLARPSYW